MLGKKIGALMVMVLFVVSMIPLALAQEGSVRVGHGKDVTETPHQKDIRDKTIVATQNFEDRRSRLNSNKGKVANCLVNSGMQGCAQTLNEDLEDRKEYLLHAVERITGVLDHLEDQAQHISDATEREDLVNHMKDKRDELHEITVKIESVNDREGLKEARDLLKGSYVDIKDMVEEYTVSTRLARLENLNSKLSKLNLRLRNIADKLESVGKNLEGEYPAKAAALQEAVDGAQVKLDAAKERYQHARDLKASGASKEELKVAISEAKSYLKQAVEKIRNSRNHVRDIIEVFKNRAGAGQLSIAIAETAE